MSLALWNWCKPHYCLGLHACDKTGPRREDPSSELIRLTLYCSSLRTHFMIKHLPVSRFQFLIWCCHCADVPALDFHISMIQATLFTFHDHVRTRLWCRFPMRSAFGKHSMEYILLGVMYDLEAESQEAAKRVSQRALRYQWRPVVRSLRWYLLSISGTSRNGRVSTSQSQRSRLYWSKRLYSLLILNKQSTWPWLMQVYETWVMDIFSFQSWTAGHGIPWPSS